MHNIKVYTYSGHNSNESPVLSFPVRPRTVTGSLTKCSDKEEATLVLVKGFAKSTHFGPEQDVCETEKNLTPDKLSR